MLLRIAPLPDDPVAAAAAFHRDELPRILEQVAAAGVLTLAFAPADHRHRGWRLAAVQSLAREAASAASARRINAVSGGDEAAIGAAVRYLERAEGVTGQLLALADGT